MILRHYPSINSDRDARIAAKLNHPPRFGEFGAVVATYRLAFGTVVDADSHGRLYFPVDTAEEAAELLESLANEGVTDYISPEKLYQRVYFVPTGVSS